MTQLHIWQPIESKSANGSWQVARTLREIAAMPGLGAVREFASARITGLRAKRVAGFPNWLIFYLIMHDEVDIVRVLHGARDLDHILTEEE